MTSKLNITPEAERDNFAITANIMQQDSIQAARQAISEFKNQLKVLADFPENGRVGASDGTREVVLSGLPYIAVYEKTNASIIIIRVLYGAEDRVHIDSAQ